MPRRRKAAGEVDEPGDREDEEELAELDAEVEGDEPDQTLGTRDAALDQRARKTPPGMSSYGTPVKAPAS